MRMDCEAAREHVDAWSLGALDAHEAKAFDAHIAGCAECRALTDAAAADAALLGLAAPVVSSSAALKSRVMSAAAVLSDIRRPRRRWWPAIAAGGVAAAFASVLTWGAWGQARINDLEGDTRAMARSATAQSGQLVALQTEVVASPAAPDDALRDAALEVALGPDATWTELTGTRLAPAAIGKCVWSRVEAIGAFVADHLPPLPPDQWYELWLVYGDDWISAGTLKVDDAGRGRLLMQGPWGRDGLGAFTGFAVTAEPTDPNAGKGRQGSMVLASFLNSR